MKILFFKNKIYEYYVEDEESTMKDIYELMNEYFNEKEWIMEGNFDEIENKLQKILSKYIINVSILDKFLKIGLCQKVINL